MWSLSKSVAKATVASLSCLTALIGCSSPPPVPVPVKVQVDQELLAPCLEPERPSAGKTFDQKRLAVIDVGAKFRLCVSKHSALVQAIQPVLDQPKQ